MSGEMHEVIELAPEPSLETDAVVVRNEITAAVIEGRDSYFVVIEAVKRIKQLIGKIEGHFAPMKKKSYDLWKTICNQESALTKPLLDAEKAGKRKMSDWDAEQARIQNLAIAKLRAEAEAKEAKAREKEAAKAEKTGDAVRAEEIRAAPSAIPILTVEAEKVAGVTYKEAWGAYEIVDPNLIPREYLTVDAAKIKKYGQAMKQDAKVAGIRFYSTRVVFVKAGEE